MPTYLDNNATTAISPEVLDAMMPFFTDRYQNVATLAGEAAGLRRALSQARNRVASLLGLRDRFETALVNRFPAAVVFGQSQPRLSNTSCFAIPGHQGSSVADSLALMDVWVGTGSACSSGALHPPRTLLAMGVSHSLASSALRVSLSKYSQDSDVDDVLHALEVATSRPL